MGLDNLGLTVFDTLGYLIPGYIVLFSISLADSTFLKNNAVSFQSIGNNIFLSAILAYFLGLFCHMIITKAISSFFDFLRIDSDHPRSKGFMGNLKLKLREIFVSEKDKLPGPMYRELIKEIIHTYSLELKETEKLNSLHLYMLADSFVVASGGGEERVSLIVREGFFKTSTMAFFIPMLLSVASLFAGGLKINLNNAGTQIELGLGLTWVFVVSSIMIFFLFRDRYSYYHRMKINNTYTLFMAYKAKEHNQTPVDEKPMNKKGND